MKAKPLVAMSAVLIIVLLCISLLFLLTANNQTNTTAIDDRTTYWTDLAKNAWNYFLPGNGVDATTGLHGAGIGWPYFTDWDLGVYIQAIVDAWRLGILSKDGTWGADARLAKILTFLENRTLTANGLPYVWYDSRTGLPYGDSPTNAADTGNLLVALENLKMYRPDLAGRIDNVVYNRTNEVLKQAIDVLGSSTNIYDYYVASGFAGFWPTRFSSVAGAILNNIVSAPKVEAYGVKLPRAKILGETVLCSVFALKPDVRLLDLAKQVYLAHEARYNATGKYVAFSEGNTGLSDPSYVYEWVVLPDGHTWVVQNAAGSNVSITPIVYFKVAVGFFALYNTDFARNMVEYIEAHLPAPTSGYADGLDENGRLVSTTIDKTNGLIIAAARYAVDNRDLSFLPFPFIQGGVANNTAIVIGESKPHGPVGAAHTIDTLGGILIMERLARDSSSGALKTAMDGWMVSYNSSSGKVTLLDNVTNLIIVGSPGINVLGYYYNNSRDPSGKPLVPVLFLVNSTGGYNYLYVPSSGSIYRMQFDAAGRLVADYGVIMVFKDQFGRYVAMVYGVGADGTRVACQVLSNYDQWSLYGSAVIVKFYSDTPGQYPSKISIVEVVP